MARPSREKDRPAARLSVRVDFGPYGALGPGKVRLLEAIDRLGSIATAGREMGMSYRRAWLLVDSINQAFQRAVVAAQRGGKEGGGTGLTPFGRDVVRRYRNIERAAADAAIRHLRAFEDSLAHEPPKALMTPPKRRG
jgi:molybdate transport system regulatory protein